MVETASPYPSEATAPLLSGPRDKAKIARIRLSSREAPAKKRESARLAATADHGVVGRAETISRQSNKTELNDLYKTIDEGLLQNQPVVGLESKSSPNVKADAMLTKSTPDLSVPTTAVTEALNGLEREIPSDMKNSAVFKSVTSPIPNKILLQLEKNIIELIHQEEDALKNKSSPRLNQLHNMDMLVLAEIIDRRNKGLIPYSYKRAKATLSEALPNIFSIANEPNDAALNKNLKLIPDDKLTSYHHILSAEQAELDKNKITYSDKISRERVAEIITAIEKEMKTRGMTTDAMRQRALTVAEKNKPEQKLFELINQFVREESIRELLHLNSTLQVKINKRMSSDMTPEQILEQAVLPAIEDEQNDILKEIMEKIKSPSKFKRITLNDLNRDTGRIRLFSKIKRMDFFPPPTDPMLYKHLAALMELRRGITTKKTPTL